MIVPEEQPYESKDYLRDAARAQKEYWIDQKRTYWPDLSKHRDVSTWQEWAGIVWFIVFVVGLVLVLVAISAHQHLPVVPVKPVHLPAFNPNPPAVSTPVPCPTVTVAGQYIPAACR